MFTYFVKCEEKTKLPYAFPPNKGRIPVTDGQFKGADMGKPIGIGDDRMDILAHVGWKPGDVTIDCSAISTFGKNMGGLLKHGPGHEHACSNPRVIETACARENCHCRLSSLLSPERRGNLEETALRGAYCEGQYQQSQNWLCHGAVPWYCAASMNATSSGMAAETLRSE